ncbi:MAG TPA: hypothetical protein VJ998_12405 [Pseudomonadales bacterium]|nr:hypothetical protein [Pseudomonadales bacterium]
MNKLNNIVTSIAFAATLFAGNAMAATDGGLGANSTGTSDVTLSIADRVQVTDVHDIALGAYGGTGNMTGTSDFCVYRSGGDNYKLTVTTDNGAYAVTSISTGDSIPFTAQVDDSLTAATTGEALSYNTATSTALVGSSSLTCGGVDNAQLYVSFAESDLQAASTASDYQATVTLYVEPI